MKIIISVNLRLFFLLFLYVVAQNNSHVCVARKMLRVNRRQIVTNDGIVVWRAQITAGRVWRRGIQRRHAFKQIRFVDVARLILIDIRQNLCVLFAVAHGSC